MLKKEISVDIKLTPMDLATEFCEMDGEQQAEFFNLLSQLSRAWDKPLVFQLQAITDSEVLTLDGRSAMASIGEYS
jgi:hypothetical protein